MLICVLILACRISAFNATTETNSHLYHRKRKSNKTVVTITVNDLYTRFATARRSDGRPGGTISNLVSPVRLTPHYAFAVHYLQTKSVNGETGQCLQSSRYESYARFEYWAQVPKSETAIDTENGTFVGQWHTPARFRSLIDDLILHPVRTEEVVVVRFSLPDTSQGYWIQDGVHRVAFFAAVHGINASFPVSVQEYESDLDSMPNHSHEDEWPAVFGIADRGIETIAPWIFCDYMPHNFYFVTGEIE